jgi:hypothetical protein
VLHRQVSHYGHLTNSYTLQQQAMVSAFALLFGLYSATHIFRAYVFGVGDPVRLLQHRTLIVHGPDCTPIDVQLHKWEGLLIMVMDGGVNVL